MRRAARFTFLALVMVPSMLFASVDRMNWVDRSAWNCVRTIAVRPFTVNEFAGPKSQYEYMEYFVTRLSAALVKPGGIQKVTLVKPGEAVNADAIITGTFVELSTGSRAARFIIGFGVGSAKCDVRIRALGPDERTPIFDLDHARASPFSLSGDANIGDIDAVTEDIGEVLLEQRGACGRPKTSSAASPSEQPRAVQAVTAPPPPARVEPSGEGAHVAIESSVTNAEVWVDGKFVGNAPLTDIRVAAGAHDIEVRSPGFTPWKRNLTVENGGKTRVVAQLEVSPQ
jgi:hypothetical protein